MKLEKIAIKIRCEFGACPNVASHTIVLDKVGIGSRVHICSECLEKLAKLVNGSGVKMEVEKIKKASTKEKIKTAIKNIETLKPKTVSV